MTTHVFVSGNPALDLAGTLKWRGTDEPEELLASVRELRDWIRRSGLTDRPPAVTTADLARVVRLREAIYSLVTATQAGVRPAADAVTTVNAAAGFAPLNPSYRRGALRTGGDLTALLSTLARAAIEAVTVDGELLKSCGRTPCSRIFLDRSRGSRRTWCGMAECGARVKMAEYRRRQRSGRGSSGPASRPDVAASGRAQDGSRESRGSGG